ncbi:unnamed protein product, partial [Meganyctiphanes norvegica]
TGQSPFKCIHCEKCFSTHNHLMKHLRTHTSEKPYRSQTVDRPYTCLPYTCFNCDQAFSQTSDLLNHQRTHIGEKAYQCNHCDKSFALKTSLLCHLIDYHQIFIH